MATLAQGSLDQVLSSEAEGLGVLRSLQHFIAGTIQATEKLGALVGKVIVEDVGNFLVELTKHEQAPCGLFVYVPSALRRRESDRWTASWSLDVWERPQINRQIAGNLPCVEMAELAAASLDRETPPWMGWSELRVESITIGQKGELTFWSVAGTADIRLMRREVKNG